MDPDIAFTWGKGASIKIDLLGTILHHNKNRKPCYINILAEKTGLSHVAIKKHVDEMLEAGHIEILNPNGKPRYIFLTTKGQEIIEKIKQYKNEDSLFNEDGTKEGL